MQATDDLRHEHEAVRLMLGIMDEIAKKIDLETEIDKKDLVDMAEFLKIFVDRCHHGKEENILFPELESLGMPNEGGPIGVMLEEHEKGRGYVREMNRTISDYASGNKASSADIAKNIRAYTRLMEQHIQKENDVLFEMTDKLLDEKKQEALFEKFEEHEEKVIGAGKHEELHEMLEKMSEKYQV